MTEIVVVPEQQKTSVVVEPQKPDAIVDGVVVPKAELDALKHKAEVSSQNFERFKKAKEREEELEAEIASLRDKVPSGFQDERVDALQNDLAELRAKQERADVLELHPVLKGEWASFEKFREDPENAKMSLKTAAKVFLTEKGLMGDNQRKGLEKPTGGDRTPVTSGMTAEEVKRLRDTDYRKYSDMVRKGQIKITS
jgi:DNA repair exonuclease SbcCD ATPase subunit